MLNSQTPTVHPPKWAEHMPRASRKNTTIPEMAKLNTEYQSSTWACKTGSVFSNFSPLIVLNVPPSFPLFTLQKSNAVALKYKNWKLQHRLKKKSTLSNILNCKCFRLSGQDDFEIFRGNFRNQEHNECMKIVCWGNNYIIPPKLSWNLSAVCCKYIHAPFQWWM